MSKRGQLRTSRALAIVISSVSPDRLSRSGAELRRLAGIAHVWLAGTGAGEALAMRHGQHSSRSTRWPQRTA
jgi:hypothetical protein